MAHGLIGRMARGLERRRAFRNRLADQGVVLAGVVQPGHLVGVRPGGREFVGVVIFRERLVGIVVDDVVAGWIRQWVGLWRCIQSVRAAIVRHDAVALRCIVDR